MATVVFPPETVTVPVKVNSCPTVTPVDAATALTMTRTLVPLGMRAPLADALRLPPAVAVEAEAVNLLEGYVMLT